MRSSAMTRCRTVESVANAMGWVAGRVAPVVRCSGSGDVLGKDASEANLRRGCNVAGDVQWMTRRPSVGLRAGVASQRRRSAGPGRFSRGRRHATEEEWAPPPTTTAPARGSEHTWGWADGAGRGATQRRGRECEWEWEGSASVRATSSFPRHRSIRASIRAWISRHRGRPRWAYRRATAGGGQKGVHVYGGQGRRVLVLWCVAKRRRGTNEKLFPGRAQGAGAAKRAQARRGTYRGNMTYLACRASIWP